MDCAVTIGNKEWNFNIRVLIFKENDTHIAYCPALDVSTSGKSEDESIKNFREMLQLHIEWCIEHGTLERDLLEHGL